jgi:microcystin-dependent protein
MWSGTQFDVPAGWAFCDGTNGTPNLTEKFIICASANYPPTQTGGAASVALVKANLPNYDLPITDPSHSHIYQEAGTLQVQSGNTTGCLTELSSSSTTSSTTGITVNSGGGDTAFSIIPPYYALAYIMKL